MTRPARLCLDCNVVTVAGSRCPSCSRNRQAQDNAARGGSGYRWQQTRAAVLERDGYSCQECGAYAVEVDHLNPLHHGGRTEMSNLQALCHDHHREKTARERTR